MLQTERSFTLDADALQVAYKRLMAEAHPDRHGQASPEQQQRVADHASDITDAYAILKSPHTRATHLLELLGAPLNEDTSGGILGPDFLMHVMEVREELEEAGTEVERLQALRSANRETVAELLEQLGVAFAASSGLDEARALTARLQYLQRIEEEIHARMPVE